MSVAHPTSVHAAFLHDRLLIKQVPDQEERLLLKLAERERLMPPDAARASVLEDVVAQKLIGEGVPDLAAMLVSEQPAEGDLIQLTQSFYFKREDSENGSFRKSLAVDASIEVGGRFSLARAVGDTGRTELSGHKTMTVLAHVESFTPGPGGALRLRPLFIGWRAIKVPGLGEMRERRPEVFISQIGEFEAAAKVRPTKSELDVVGGMSERAVNDAFADIVGEPFTTPDWGGENSDLFTGRLTLDGDPATAAFAFKGPGLKKDLYPSGMGKNGDQGLRLANQPADLLVVQHHRRIDPSVRYLMDAVCRRTGKLYCIVDGATTAAVLKTYGRLPT